MEELGKGASHSSWIDWLYGGQVPPLARSPLRERAELAARCAFGEHQEWVEQKTFGVLARG